MGWGGMARLSLELENQPQPQVMGKQEGMQTVFPSLTQQQLEFL